MIIIDDADAPIGLGKALRDWPRRLPLWETRTRPPPPFRSAPPDTAAMRRDRWYRKFPSDPPHLLSTASRRPFVFLIITYFPHARKGNIFVFARTLVNQIVNKAESIPFARILCGSSQKKRKHGTGISLPILCFPSVTGLRVFALAGHMADGPEPSLACIHFPLFLFRELLIRDKLLHCGSLLLFV